MPLPVENAENPLSFHTAWSDTLNAFNASKISHSFHLRASWLNLDEERHGVDS